MKKLPIFPSLPPMQCDDDCGECCGPIPVSEATYQKLRRFVRERAVVAAFDATAPERCPFYQGGCCAVYEARPLICRAFGHVDHPLLTCPRSYNANVSSSAKTQIDAAIAAEGVPVRLLHELSLEADPSRAIDLNELWEMFRPRQAPRTPHRNTGRAQGV